ncbi:ABC transporter ATP-binding protein [Enemella sp. A6]|uniref:ABC transporter ATP-binding protein n=1 Tax=Enemella sp. A6 TaxID=3440152 RepID=UPI003EBC80FE
MSPSGQPALNVTDLTVRFGATTALDGLSLTAETGRVTALLGPNGAGKTTLIRCATDIVTPDGGRVEVFGLPPKDACARGLVGVMPQSTGAWSYIRPLELLSYLAKLHANPLPVDALAKQLGLHEFARTPYRRLSGGQQQAVNLAGALIGRPSLVVLDEPTAGMDPHARHAVWNLIARLREAGTSVLLTTHAMDEAAHLADHIWIVEHGEVRVHGTLAELTADGRDLETVYLTSTKPRMVP